MRIGTGFVLATGTRCQGLHIPALCRALRGFRVSMFGEFSFEGIALWLLCFQCARYLGLRHLGIGVFVHCFRKGSTVSGIREFRLEQVGCWSFKVSIIRCCGFGLAESELGFRLAKVWVRVDDFGLQSVERLRSLRGDHISSANTFMKNFPEIAREHRGR